MINVVAAALFVFLALVNVQIIANANGGSGLDLAGLKLDAFMPSAVATAPPMTCPGGLYDCWSTPDGWDFFRWWHTPR